MADTLVETDFTNDALLVDGVQILIGKVMSYLFVSKYFTRCSYFEVKPIRNFSKCNHS